MEQSGKTRITILPTPPQYAVFVASAESDPELHAAMIADGWSSAPKANAGGASSGKPNTIKTASDEKAMTDQIGRSELTSTLSAIEERMDKRVERIEKDTDRRAEEFRREFELREEAFRREQAVRDKALDERFSGFLTAQSERDKRIDSEIKRIADANAEIKAGIASMKTTVIITAISAALAIVGGIAAFNATLTSNMLSAFQAGKAETTPAHITPKQESTKQ